MGSTINGTFLIAHCSTDLYYLHRHAPFKTVTLVDSQITVNFAELNHLDDSLILVATQPLTQNEHWIKMARGELLIFKQGAVYSASSQTYRFSS